MKKQRKILSILLVICLVCGNLPGTTVNAEQKTIDISNLSSWDGVTNYMPDSNDDAGGGGYELTKFYVANDASYIYLRWDIQLSGQNVTDMVSTNLGSAFSCSSDGSTADAMAWLLFDNKGAVTASLERLTGTEQSVSIDSSEVKRFNTGSENALISVVTRVPFSAFATIGFADYFASDKIFPLWCQTNASSSLTANIKDRIPDSGYFSYDAATGNAAIVGAGLSNAKDFLTFSVTGQTGNTVIDSANHTISVQIPAETSLTSIQPTFTLSDLAKGVYVNNVPQSSGTSSQNFTQPVTYTVVAEDSSTQDWQVTITSTPDAPTDTPEAPTDTPAASTDSLSVHDISYIPDGSEQIIDSNLAIIASDNLTGAKVYIDQNFNSDKDSIVFDSADVPSGLSASYDTENGVLTVSGTATADVYQTFLRTLKFSTTDTSGTKSINYLLSKSENDVMYCSDTGHFYEYVPYSALDDTSWTTAKASAEQRTYNGLTGYLATITSAEENAFVTSKCGGAGWLGASDMDATTNNPTGIWKWVTGPEAGTEFYDYSAGTTLDSQYNNWASGEPNGSGSSGFEHYLHIFGNEGVQRPAWAFDYSSFPAGSWNDYSGISPYGSIFGYVVEYGDTYVSLSSSSGLSGVSNIVIASGDSLSVHDLSYLPGSSEQIIDSNFTITSSDNITGAKVYIDQNFNSDKDSILFNSADVPSGLSASYDSTNGVLTVSGTATADVYQTFLRTLKFSTTDTGVTKTINYILNKTGNDIMYCTDTGHFYEYIPGTMSWSAARTSAEQRSYNGMTGYLATITSEEENAFVTSKCGGSGWLGASDFSSVTGDTTGMWKWVTGPETGITFYNFDTKSVINSQYNNWATGEPNNYNNTGEYYLHIYTTGAWNDYKVNDSAIAGYIVEYGDAYVSLGSSSGLTGVTNITVPANTIIEPQLTINVTGNPTDWVPTANLNINTTVDASGIKSVTANGIDITSSYTDGYTVSQNGTYTFVVTSNSGLTATQTVDVTKIDSTTPNNAVITNAENYTADQWYKTNQTVAATFTPTAGSTEKLQYSLDGGNTWTDGSSVEVTTEGVTAVKFRIIDELGNISEVQTTTVQIDKTAPVNAKIIAKGNEFTSFLNQITFGLFFKDTVEVSITAEDGSSGIKTIEYQKVEDKSAYDENGTWTNGASFSVTPDDKFIVYARITDNVGNSTIINTNGIITDSTVPQLTLSDVSGWNTSDVSVGVTVGDSFAGVKEVTYTTDEAVPQTGTVSITNGTGTINLTNEGKYKLTVTAKDNSGNTVTKNTDIQLDKTQPNNLIITDADNYSADIWYKTNQTVAATFAPTAGSTEKLQYSLDGGNTWSDGSSVEVTAEGITAVKFRIIDELGNISQVQTTTVQIDKTAPVNAKIIAKGNEFTSFLNQITFGLFFKDTVNVSITAEDASSGIKTIEYQKVEDKSAYDENGAWTNGASFSVTPDDKFIVYARITDNAGNSTIINTNGFITDSTIPQLVLSDVSGWNTSDVSVRVTVGDSLSGVKEVTYTTDEAVPQTGTVSITNSKGTINLTKEGKYKLTVTAKDNSGNTVTKTVDIQLDKTQPNNLVITDADNYTADKWYKTNQTVATTFTPTAGSTEKLQYSLDGGRTWTDGSSVEVTTEGKTAVKFRIIDELGNISAVQTVTVQIDKTEPNAPKVDEIDSSTTKITGTADAGTIITVKNASGIVLGETTVGADGVYSISIETQEASTNLYVTATDIAGNISNVVTLTVKTINSYVSAMIDALPDPITASDSEIINAQEDITDTKKHYDALDDAGRKAISAGRKEKLNQLTDRLNALLVIISKDKATGVTARGIGTAVIIPELNDSDIGKIKISLEVNPIITESAADIPANIEIASNTLHTDGREIIEVYDISLIKSIYGVTGSLVSKAKVNNSNIVDYITVRFPVPAGYEGRKDLGVIYINDNGIITPLKSKVITSNGTQYIEFQTNHFSNYAIVASTATSTTTSTNPKTGDVAPLIGLYILFGLSGAIILILILIRIRSKSNRSKNNRSKSNRSIF